MGILTKNPVQDFSPKEKIGKYIEEKDSAQNHKKAQIKKYGHKLSEKL